MNNSQFVQCDPQDEYVFPRSDTERERLETQQKFIINLLGGRLIVDKHVKVKPRHRILDAGTGAASWLSDLAKVVPVTVKLVGIDISSAFFPEFLAKNTKLYEMSILSMPARWTNRFHFIHSRLLAVAFTTHQWHTACSELYRVLKPGGAIQFVEYGHYRLLLEINPHPALRKVLDMVDTVMHKRGVLLKDVGLELPGMLEQSGFSNIKVEICNLPIGKQSGSLGTVGARNLEMLLRGIGATLLAEVDGLEMDKSRAEVDQMIEDAMRVCDETPGLFVPLYAITARKRF